MKVGKWICMNSCNSILVPKSKKEIDEDLNKLSSTKKFGVLVLHEISDIINDSSFEFIDVVIKKIEYKINEVADKCEVNVKVEKHILERGTIDLMIYVQKKAPETMWFVSSEKETKVFKIIIRV